MIWSIWYNILYDPYCTSSSGYWVLFHVSWRYHKFINGDPTFLIRKDVNSQTFVENFISSVFLSSLLPFVFQNFFHFIPFRVFVFQSEFFIPHSWSNFMLKHIVSLQLIVTDTWFATKKGNNTMPMPTNTFYLFKFSKPNIVRGPWTVRGLTYDDIVNGRRMNYFVCRPTKSHNRN